MVGFLGMALAGGAMGARDASNNSVRALNELEIGDARERLREEFANRRFDKEMAFSKESAKAKAQQDDIKYQRDMEGKKAQYNHEIEKTGLLNKGRMDAASLREAGANARNSQRLSQAEKLAQAKSSGSSNEDLQVTLKDGRKYLPQTQIEKDARALVIAGVAGSYEDAIRGIQSGKLLSPAMASDPRIFSSQAAADTAGSMVNQLFGEKKKEADQVQRFKLTDLIK